MIIALAEALDIIYGLGLMGYFSCLAFYCIRPFVILRISCGLRPKETSARVDHWPTVVGSVSWHVLHYFACSLLRFPSRPSALFVRRLVSRVGIVCLLG